MKAYQMKRQVFRIAAVGLLCAVGRLCIVANVARAEEPQPPAAASQPAPPSEPVAPSQPAPPSVDLVAPEETLEGEINIEVPPPPAAPGRRDRVLRRFVQSVKLPEYWLGLECNPVDDALRSHLQLPEGEGLVVRSVVPDSPAAKAAVQTHDILVAADVVRLNKVEDLLRAVEAKKELPINLELIREGKRTHVSITPAKRPAAEGRPRGGLFELQGRPGQIALHFMQPGIVLPAENADLPADLKVQINKEGNQPAKINVKRGANEWTVTDEELDKLPDDVRPHVERVLASLTSRHFNLNLPVPPNPMRFFVDESVVPGAGSPFSKQLEEQLQEANKQLAEQAAIMNKRLVEQSSLVKKELQRQHEAMQRQVREAIEQHRKEIERLRQPDVPRPEGADKADKPNDPPQGEPEATPEKI